MEIQDYQQPSDGQPPLARILYVAYYYPPIGGSGVQRSSKMAKYLSRLGHPVTVLSVDIAQGQPLDATLSRDIEPSIEVLRTQHQSGWLMATGLRIVRGLSRRIAGRRGLRKSDTDIAEQTPARWQGCAQKLLSWAGHCFLQVYRAVVVPDDCRGWRKTAVSHVLSDLENGRWDALITTSSPLTAHLIGLDLKRATNVPWVADFRDAWLSNPFLHLPALTRGRHAALEQRVINEADAVVSVSEPISKDFRTRYRDHKDKFITITNGYDPEDFDLGPSSSDSGPYRDNRPFSISYIGTLCKGRSPAAFLDVISSLLQEEVLNANSIRIVFVGRVAVEHKQCMTEFQLRHPGVLETHDYMEHDRAIGIMTQSDCNLLLLRGGAGSDGVATGKIYEYLAANRPILAVVQDGVAADIVRATEAGVVARPDNPDAIREAILTCLEWSKCGDDFLPDRKTIEAHSRASQAKDLSVLIQHLKDSTSSARETLK